MYSFLRHLTGFSKGSPKELNVGARAKGDRYSHSQDLLDLSGVLDWSTKFYRSTFLLFPSPNPATPNFLQHRPYCLQEDNNRIDISF